MFNVYKVVITFDTGMQHVDDVGGEWKTVRETTSALDRICHGPAGASSTGQGYRRPRHGGLPCSKEQGR